MGTKGDNPIFQALAPYRGRLLCSRRACPSYTLYGSYIIANCVKNVLLRLFYMLSERGKKRRRVSGIPLRLPFPVQLAARKKGAKPVRSLGSGKKFDLMNYKVLK